MGACLGTETRPQSTTSSTSTTTSSTSTKKNYAAPPSDYARRQDDSKENKELADLAFQVGNYGLAAELYLEAIDDADPQDTENVAGLYADRAAALGSLGKHADAVQDCEQALRLKPDYPVVLLRKGRLHIRLGQWLLATQALEACRDSASANPATVQEANVVLAQIASDRREYEEREERKKKAQADAERAKKEAEDRKNTREEAKRQQAIDAKKQEATANETHSVGLYADLEIKWSATDSEVKKAYRKLSLIHHPDKNRGDHAADERFKRIKNAFEILSDEANRRAYDAELRAKGWPVPSEAERKRKEAEDNARTERAQAEAEVEEARRQREDDAPKEREREQAEAEEAEREARDRKNAREEAGRQQADRNYMDGNHTRQTYDSVGLYAALGIKWSATASEVKKAYHKLSLINHPDKNRGDPAAGERFKIIKNAFEILSDEAKRRAYDAGLRAEGWSAR